MTWQIDILAQGKWRRSQFVLATPEEATDCARALVRRYRAADDFRLVDSALPPNFTWVGIGPAELFSAGLKPVRIN